MLTLDGDTLVATPTPTSTIPGRNPHRQHPGLAADITWTPDHAGLSVESGGQTVVSVVRDNDELTVAVGEKAWAFPYSGDVRVIFDGPVLEIASGAGLFAAPITPNGTTLTVRGGNSEIAGHALGR